MTKAEYMATVVNAFLEWGKIFQKCFDPLSLRIYPSLKETNAAKITRNLKKVVEKTSTNSLGSSSSPPLEVT